MNKLVRQLYSIEWKLVMIFLLLIVIAMQFVGVYFIRQLEEFYLDVLKKDLQRQVTLLYEPTKNVLIDPQLGDEERKKRLSTLLNELVFLKMRDKTTPTVQINIIDNNGFILNSTLKNEQQVNSKKRILLNQNTKKEYYQVLREPGNNHNYQIFVKPILNKDDRRIGSIYIESSLSSTYKTVRYISKILIKIGAIALLLIIVLVVILARTITTPIKEITRQASAMARGNFDLQVDVRSRDEIGNLAIEFNYLASHLRKALSQKEEEKEKLESVLANMSDGVIATNPDGNIIIKNKRAEELLDRPIARLQSLQEVLSLTESFSFPLNEERSTFLELRSEDENNTIIRITATPIRLNEKIVGTIVLLGDVTEQERLDRQRKDFVANVSHELRTPLTTIKSYLEALDEGALHDQETAARFVGVARQEADRMTRLIQELLQLSRLEAKQSRFQKKAADLEAILIDVAHRFHFQCTQNNISFSALISSPLPRVYVDQDKIEQVLDNLISNAIKYTPKHGAVAVIAKRKEDGMVEVSVIDSGIGIPKKDLGRIFERFYRVDKARSRSLGGTGLGLSISQEIIQAHGGTIDIHSLYKRGTIVSFTLPPCEPEVIL